MFLIPTQLLLHQLFLHLARTTRRHFLFPELCINSTRFTNQGTSCRQPAGSNLTARWSFLLIGMFYGKQRYDYLKPRAEEERRVEEAEKKIREEQEKIAKALVEASEDTILK
uniref:ATP synthase F(0) complex subunit e, mitochondrial n=1 Tax=Oncorhynchus tshawytscha TaxID=74940 RepID=A0AAZ3R0V3_ONCTS